MISKDRDAILHVSLLLLFAALMGGLLPLIKFGKPARFATSLKLPSALTSTSGPPPKGTMANGMLRRKK